MRSAPTPVRIENLEIDAARDRPQPVGSDPIGSGDVMGNEVRNRNDAVTPRHDGIVASFQSVARAVGVVKCRHEGTPGGVGGRPGTPCGGAAAGVDDVDAELPHQARQLRGVAAHDQRVLRGEWQRQVSGACPGNVMLQRTAARGDIGDPSRFDQRARELDGAALGAAGHEAGQDLQHRRRAPCRHSGQDAIVDAHSALPNTHDEFACQSNTR